MRFDFIKCHGSGNDFPMVDARAMALTDNDWARVARAFADRTGPVGGDGLLLLTTGDADHAFGMRMFNSDGSEAETCLNGLRCVARAGFEALGLQAARVRLKTSSAEATLDAPLAPGVVTIREVAGPADLDVARWPLAGAATGGGRIVDAVVPRLGSDRRFVAVAMPNPHLVSFVEVIDDAELSAIGGVCEAAPDWLPNRANVSFVEQRGDDLFVRTFERGVGLTNSCGSAMAASTYAACMIGRIDYDREVQVLNAGGMVRAMAGRDAMVMLSGNATYEWAGSIDIDVDSGAIGAISVTRQFGQEVAAWANVINDIQIG